MQSCRQRKNKPTPWNKRQRCCIQIKDEIGQLSKEKSQLNTSLIRLGNNFEKRLVWWVETSVGQQRSTKKLKVEGEKTSVRLLWTPFTLHIEWAEEIYHSIRKWRLIRGKMFFRQVGHRLLHMGFFRLRQSTHLSRTRRKSDFAYNIQNFWRRTQSLVIVTHY